MLSNMVSLISALHPALWALFLTTNNHRFYLCLEQPIDEPIDVLSEPF